MASNEPKKKLKYTVLMVPNNAHKVKQFHISFDLVLIITMVLFILLFSGITYIAYTASHVEDLEAIVSDMKKSNQSLEDQNIVLQANVEELTNTLHDAKIAIDATNTAKEKQEKEATKQYIPNGFPVDGAAALPTKYTEETHYVVFTLGNGTKVVAAADGVVSYVGDSAEFGHVVKVDHGNGYVSIYMAESKPNVSEGDKVIRGTTLYVMESDNEKMTYQVQFNEQFIDPMSVIEING